MSLSLRLVMELGLDFESSGHLIFSVGLPCPGTFKAKFAIFEQKNANSPNLQASRCGILRAQAGVSLRRAKRAGVEGCVRGPRESSGPGARDAS